LGAVGGASVGAAAFYPAAQWIRGEPATVSGTLQAAAIGATAEAGGQVLGKLLLLYGARATGQATGETIRGGSLAASSLQGALLRAQLAAEEGAGARLPQAITGFTRHGLNQAISRDGVGVSTRAIFDAFQNPLSIIGQNGGRFILTGTNAVVVVNAEGQVITTWATRSAGFRIIP
jgi:hypothetical protein